MLADVRDFAAAGRSVYAECGGLMYLGRTLTTVEGVRYPMAGVLPIETAMLEKLKVLGYTEVTWAADSLWGDAGQSGARSRVPLLRNHRCGRSGRRLAAGLLGPAARRRAGPRGFCTG